MRDQAGDVIDLAPGRLQHLLDGSGHTTNSRLEHLVAVHHQPLMIARRRDLCREWAARAASFCGFSGPHWDPG